MTPDEHRAFELIERLGSICATPGIRDDIKNVANDNIQRILDVVLPPLTTGVCAALSNIII